MWRRVIPRSGYFVKEIIKEFDDVSSRSAERFIDLYPEMASLASELRMPKQQLYRPNSDAHRHDPACQAGQQHHERWWHAPHGKQPEREQRQPKVRLAVDGTCPNRVI
ncbi:hypothetical protein D3C87_1668870 [compost metagenome]